MQQDDRKAICTLETIEFQHNWLRHVRVFYQYVDETTIRESCYRQDLGWFVRGQGGGIVTTTAKPNSPIAATCWSDPSSKSIQISVFHLGKDGELCQRQSGNDITSKWTLETNNAEFKRLAIAFSSQLAVALSTEKNQILHLFYQKNGPGVKAALGEIQYNIADGKWQIQPVDLVKDAIAGTRLSAVADSTRRKVCLYYQDSRSMLREICATNYVKWGTPALICPDRLEEKAPIAAISWPKILPGSGERVGEIRVFTALRKKRAIVQLSCTAGQQQQWGQPTTIISSFRDGLDIAAVRGHGLGTTNRTPICILHHSKHRGIQMHYLPVDEEYVGRELLLSDIARPSSVPMIIDSDLNGSRESHQEGVDDRDRWKESFEKDRDKWNREIEKERKENELLSSELRNITADRDKWQTESERRQKQLEETEKQKNATARQKQSNLTVRTPIEEEQWVPQLIIEGHSRNICCIAFSPNGKWIASGSHDGSMIIRDARTGTQVSRFSTTNPYAKSAPFSPDGRSIAYTGSASLWDPMTGQERIRLQGNVVMDETIAFSPDGKLVASGYRTTILVWDASTGVLKQRLVKPGFENVEVDTVRHIAFSPDGKTLASASWWNTVTLWDTMTWTMQRMLDLKTGYIYQIAFSPDGKLLATASSESRIRLWEVATGSERPSLNTFSGCVSRCVGFSPDGTLIAAGGNHQAVMVWDAKTGALVKELDRHRLWRCVDSLMFSPDSKALAFGNHDGKIKVFAKN